MSIYHTIILGIIEGLTEFLPVSSTGHLILVSHFLGQTQDTFTTSFDIAIQVGAIMAVVILYWKSLFLNMRIIKRITAAFIPTAIIGLAFYKIIKNLLLGSEQVVIWSLLIGGIVLVIFELLYKQKVNVVSDIEEITYKQAILIGIFQTFAMVPGVSRSAATIIGGLCLGLERKTIVEFSFLLAVPTMFAATGLDLIKNMHVFTFDQMGILFLGLFVSFVVAMVSVKALLFYVKRYNFIPFGIYRVLISLLAMYFI